MGKRLSAEAKILSLYEGLTDEGRRIIYDLLKLKQQPAAKRATSTRKATPKPPAGSAAKALAKSTGASLEDVQTALNDASGDEDTAIQLLQARKQVAHHA